MNKLKFRQKRSAFDRKIINILFYHIPVTDENLKESVTAVENGGQINEIDDNTAANMVKIILALIV